MLTLANRLMAKAQDKTFRFVGRQLWAEVASSPWTVNFDTLVDGYDNTIREGDLLVLAVALASGSSPGTISTPSGWTLIVSDDATDTRSTTLDVFYRVAGATPPTSASVTLSPTGTARSAILLVFRNFDPSSPIKQSGAVPKTSGTLCNPPALTSTANAVYLCFGGGSINLTGTPTPYTCSNFANFYSTSVNHEGSADSVIGGGWDESSNDPAQFGSTQSSTSASAVGASVRISKLVA